MLVLLGLTASLGCPPAKDASTSSTSSGTSSKNSGESTTSPKQTAATSSNETAQPEVTESETESSGPELEGPTQAASGQDDSTQEKTRVDAVLFEGWEKPAFAFFVTGRQMGYIEPCGCTGLSNQKGGLMRRHSFYTDLQDKGWELVPIDAGNQVRRFGMQPVIKFDRTFETLAQQMDYQAIAFGPDDLRLDAIDIFQTVLNHQQSANPYISANVDVLDGQFEKYRVIEVAGVKIGITSVLGDNFHDSINNSEVKITSIAESLPGVIDSLKGEECDLNVLLSHTTIADSEELAKTYPFFDLMVSAGGDGEPTKDPEAITVGDHTTSMILTGYKGMYVGVVGYFPNSDQKLRYQRVPLDDRFADSEAVKQIFTEYQEQLKKLGLAGLDIREIEHSSGNEFVGSESCGDCHTVAYDIWKNGVDGNGGPHAHATVSLVEPNERNWVQRYHDPECLSCHVTGWNPQKYYPYKSGYLELEASSYLHGNGCENCHGPGSAHVAAETGDIDADDEKLSELREQLRVTVEEAKANLCITCHDLDNSPDFHVEGAWEEYWPQIEHKGVD